MPFVAAPAAGLLVPGGVIAVFTPGLIAGVPGVIAGAPGLSAVPLPGCGWMAVELLPGVIAVRGAPEAGAAAPAPPAPELACA